MDIAKIREKYNNGDYTHKHAILVELPVEHVFDENLSVKTNREMLEEYNCKIREQRAENRAKQAALDKQLHDDVINYLVNAYCFNKAQATLIERWVYTEHHSFMCDYFNNIDTMADFADDLINID